MWSFAHSYWHILNQKKHDVHWFLEIYVYTGFDVSNMLQTSGHRGNKRLGKLWNTPKTPVSIIPQVERFIGNSWWYHDWVWKGVPQEAQLLTSKARLEGGLRGFYCFFVVVSASIWCSTLLFYFIHISVDTHILVLHVLYHASVLQV